MPEPAARAAHYMFRMRDLLKQTGGITLFIFASVAQYTNRSFMCSLMHERPSGPLMRVTTRHNGRCNDPYSIIIYQIYTRIFHPDKVVSTSHYYHWKRQRYRRRYKESNNTRPAMCVRTPLLS